MSFSPSLQLINDALFTRTALLPAELQVIHDELQLLREAASGVLTWRQGNLPTLGYIKDNDVSRAAIKTLADAVGWDS